MTRPILYSFRRCPYAIRARLALLASETEWEHREIKLSAKPPEMLAVSPKATAPVLVLPEGAVIDESIDIMHWALARSDPLNLLCGADNPLIEANDGTFKHHLDRYKYSERHQADPQEHRAAGLAILTGYEARLSAGANLCGEQPTLTDLALVPFVRQFAHVDRDWFQAQPLPRVQAWLARHLASPLFVTAMIKHEPWRPDGWTAPTSAR